MGTTDIKVCVVGNVGVGKKCLLWTIEGVKSPLGCIKIPNISPKEVRRNNKKYILTFSYVSGYKEFARLRQYAYQNSHVFLMCFALNDRKSYENLIIQWIPDIRQYRSNASIILVGTKSDLKDTTVKAGGGFWQKPDMKVECDDYVECSSKTKENVYEICEKIVAAYLTKNANKENIVCVIT